MTNLLLIVADQFRAQAITPGADPVDTPIIDRLAQGGVRLTQAISSYPVCSPHRAMLMTGESPQNNGVWLNVNSFTKPLGVGIDAHTTSWAKVLSDAGYETGWIGKWHLQPPVADDEIYGEGRRADDGKVWDAWSPPDARLGFTWWYSYGCSDNHLNPHYWETDAPREEPVWVEQWAPEHETDKACEFLGEVGDRPFALVVSWNPPHQPFEQLPHGVHEHLGDGASLLNRPNITDGIRDEAERVAPLYFSAVEEIDTQVGRLLARLDELGLRDDTVVMFTSDHGSQIGSHGRIDKNVPFEESMLIPCVVSHPALPAGSTVDVLLGSLDFAPTLLGLVGHGADIPAQFQGTDLSGVVRGLEPVDADRAVPFFRFSADPLEPQMRGIRTARHLWVLATENGVVTRTCHDLVEDPYQLDPVEDAALDGRLSRRLQRMLADLGHPWQPLDDWIGEK